ncbi:hypothetical protein ACFQVD_00150 [Streptosporangium amethystogenes subsp. fukuiense]|uniref:Integrase n=1 Tax=Streptosporangium amethystogenes subsp. fukuiense TaxID=698418 RepID=A0ABW2SQE9_9ACTN
MRKKAIPLAVKAANQGGQQLFLANADQRLRLSTTRRSPPPRPPQPGLSPIRPVDHRQLTLIDPPRDLAAGLHAGLPSPPDVALAEAFEHFVAEHAERYGWTPATCRNVRRGLRIVLTLQETPGARIKASDILLLGQVPSAFQVARTIEIVELAGMLDDDRIPAIVNWFDTKIAGLPGPMQEELRVWFEVMRHGSTKPPRRRPRREGTIRMKLSRALPALRRWADQHTSLREISRDDVLAVLPASGSPRVGAVQGIRSIFTVLKEHKLVFTNPTARIQTGPPTPTIPLPVDLDALRAAIHSSNPARAALASLQAFHALRSRQLRQLQLTDLLDGRLHIDGRVIPLAPEVRTRLVAWLDHRNQRWPRTANPHLFITTDTAIRTGPVSHTWINEIIGISPQAIREDRILDEAIATGDVRRICDLFGLTVEAALRYTERGGPAR